MKVTVTLGKNGRRPIVCEEDQVIFFSLTSVKGLDTRVVEKGGKYKGKTYRYLKEGETF